MMIAATLHRERSTDDGTFGLFTIARGSWAKLILQSLELPDRGNARNISSIPAGRYQCARKISPRFGHVYGLADVPGRSHILIHPGNYAGDENLGRRSNSAGCILLGLDRNEFDGQRMIGKSRAALAALYNFTESQPFTLEINER